MSKAFVIKNKEGKYYKRYFDVGYVEFVDNFCFAELYTKKEGADNTKDFILRNKYRFNIENLEVVEVTIVEGDLEQQLAEKDKIIETLKKDIKTKEHIVKLYSTIASTNTTKMNIAKEIYKQVCDEIREFIDNNEHSEENDAKQSSESVVYIKQLYKFLD